MSREIREALEPSADEINAVAAALYECEKRRSNHVDELLAAAKGKPLRYHMEHWNDVADLYRDDARAAILALRSGSGGGDIDHCGYVSTDPQDFAPPSSDVSGTVRELIANGPLVAQARSIADSLCADRPDFDPKQDAEDVTAWMYARNGALAGLLQSQPPAQAEPVAAGGEEGLVERVARALWFDFVDQHGYPNGLRTWDELPDAINKRIDVQTREFMRSLARAVLATLPQPPAVPEGLREAIRGATGVQSGPNGSGRMRVIIDGFEPGREHALLNLLSDGLALLTPSPAPADETGRTGE